MNLLKMIACTAVAVVTLLTIGCSKNTVNKCSGTTQKTYPYSGFNTVTVTENLELEITQGPTYSVTATGCVENLADLNAEVLQSGTLSLKYARGVNNRKVTTIQVTVPELVRVNASDAAKVTVLGMVNTQSPIQFDFSSAASGLINNCVAPHMTVNLLGAAKLELNGRTQNLTVDLESASELKAYGMATVAVGIITGGASKAFINASGQLTADAAGTSTIYYKGNPATVNATTSGTARVLKM